MSAIMLYLPQEPLVEHKIQQQTPEWHELRKGFRTGSSASMAMGINPYVKRDAFLKSVITGEDVERSDYVKNVILAHGNDTEAEGRNAYEEEFGRVMIAGVFTRGRYLASPDGVERDEMGRVVRGYEVKCPQTRRKSKRWKAAEAGEILPHDRAQLAVQYAVLQVPIDFYVYVPAEGDRAAEGRLITYFGPSAAEWAEIESAWSKFEDDVAVGRMQADAGSKQTVFDKDERDDADWLEAAEVFQALSERIAELEPKLTEAKGRLIELANGKDSKGGGVRVTYSTRAGSVDWKAAFTAVAPKGFDTAPFKKDPTTVTTVATTKGKQ